MKLVASLPLCTVVLLWVTVLPTVYSSEVKEPFLNNVNLPLQQKTDEGWKELPLSDVDHGKALVDWLRKTKGSYFHSYLEIRKSDSNSTSPFYGMFAKDKIHANELLFEIPWSMTIMPGVPQVGDRVTVEFDDDDSDDDEDDEFEGGEHEGIVTAVNADGSYDVLCDTDTEPEPNLPLSAIEHEQWPVNCATVRLLAREMRLADDSQYAAYVNYLLTQPAGQLPTAWSKAGQILLKQVMGREDDEYILPPADAFGWLEKDWKGRCEGSDDPIEHKAYMFVKTRSWDEQLIPIFDMLSHRNGDWTNTRSESIHTGTTIKVRASRDIQAGEELFTSYNFCGECGGRYNGYGTPEILRDYGFVEDYPRRFVFAEQEIAFDIEFDSLTGNFAVEWVGNGPSEEEDLYFLEDQLERLIKVNLTTLRKPSPDIPKHELDVVSQYHDALTTAMAEAIAKVYESNKDGNGHCVEGSGTCSISSIRYPKLTIEPEVWETARPLTCDYHREFGYDEWETVYDTKTQYQEMAFDVNPTMDGDMCFDLDNVVQMCESYRPQYHEMFVHYTARFIDEVKRILFVGGGDSMLLHEALKYPSLELVVGLELDQDVTRSSFQYFGTQPHWDNEKVEWWFGDATKSLVVLPKEYFGSFDLVLVDLSETVMALTVTDELDVMEALALLVKPTGILVQNEYGHFKDHTKHFKNTLTIHYDGVPIVCSQSLVLASNGVDFLRGPYKEHNVDNLYDLLEQKDVRYKIIRDYQKNTTNPHHCNNYKGASLERSSAQVRSSGVLMIVEAEDTTVNLNSLETVQVLVTDALSKASLTVVSSAIKRTEDGCTLACILKEGYVIARAWSKHESIAYDLHFWSHFNKQDVVRKELIKVVGSNAVGISSSAFRIVAGGMYGLDNWEEESKKLGPHLEDLCTGAPPMAHNASVLQPNLPHITEVALKESMGIYKSGGHPIAVLCGHEGEECKSAELLKETAQVIPIWTCPSIGGNIEFVQDGQELMQACELEILQTLRNSSNKIHALVIDQSATHTLAQIVARIFKSVTNKIQFLTDDIFIQATILDGDDWRKAFVDYFRTNIFNEDDPVYRGEVQFHSTGNDFEVAMTMSGDQLFPQAFSRFANRVEEATGYVAEIKTLRSGDFTYAEEFESEAIFKYKDYDRTDQLKQWEEQKVLGLQTVIQFDLVHDKHDLSCEQLKRAFRETISVVVSHPKKDIETMEHSGIGEGCILVSLWPDGNVVLLWDGRNHFDVNIFSKLDEEDDEEDDDGGLGNVFQETFLNQIHTVNAKLRDQFPRGIGRVVNFPEPNDDPYWK